MFKNVKGIPGTRLEQKVVNVLSSQYVLIGSNLYQICGIKYIWV